MKPGWQTYALALVGVLIGGWLGKAIFHVGLWPAAGTVFCALAVGYIFWWGATKYIKF